MSALSDIYTIWLREMIRFVRQKSRIVSSLAMPFFWLLFIGVGFGSSFDLPGVEYTTFLAPGILGMVMLFNSIFSGLSIIWEKQFGFLKEIFVAPVSRESIMIGKVLGGTSVAFITGILMLVIMLIMGFVQPTIGILTAFVFMILTSICFVSIGLIIASVLTNTEGFQAIMSFLVMPMFFLSGALFPLDKAPQWMQYLSYLDPLTFGVDGIRGSILGTSILPLSTNFLVLLFFTSSLILLGAYMFRRMEV